MIDPDLWMHRSTGSLLSGTSGLNWLATILRLAGLGAVIYLVVTISPRPGTAGRTPWVVLLLVVASAAWLAWAASIRRPRSPRSLQLVVPSIVAVLAVAGGLLVGVSPSAAAEAIPCVGVLIASVQMPLRWSTTALVVAVIAVVVGSRIGSVPAGGLAQATLIPCGVFLFGLNRRQFHLRTAEGARSAALAERARIAREVHDLLAHSLAGLTIQLEAARALLAEHSDPAAALAHVERAHHLGVEGLAETRRAVAALREDTPPLADLLCSLAQSYGTTTTFAVNGAARYLSADVALTIYRAAQEALTNTSRHAAGSAVQIELNYGKGETSLVVVDHYPAGAVAPSRPPDPAGGGYGLVGMRERAELAGGTLHAGPCGNGWRVELRVPT